MLITPGDPHILLVHSPVHVWNILADPLGYMQNFTSCQSSAGTYCMGTQMNTDYMYVHILSYFYGVGPLSWEVGSQWDSYGTKERVATKQYKHSPSLLQQSSIAITQAWQKREGKSSKPGVSEIAMEQKRGLPQNKTNIHPLRCVCQSSPACEALV